MKLSKSVIALAMLAAGSSAFAENGWKGSVELGLILTGGNTETQSTNLKGAIEHESDKLRNEAKVEALNVKGKEGRLSEKYNASGKSSYKYNDVSYSFITAEGEHDPFSGFAYQASGTLGYGHRVINKESMVLDLEAGPGYRQTRVRGEDEEVSEGVFRLNATYVQKLTKTSEFSEALTVAVGEESTITKSVTAVTAQIVGNLSMKTSLTVKNNSEVPADTEETDTEVAATLVYSF